MFEALHAQPVDQILALMQAFQNDLRPHKIDLGVGVYRNAEGLTPVMRAVKAAEHRIWQSQGTKSYVGMVGAADYLDAMAELVLGPAVPRESVAAAATPGGTGALRQGFEMIRMANPAARVFVSDPTWPNHLAMLSYLGIETVPYRYFDTASRGVDVEGMLADLAKARPGDVVLLHGCCHNPTGADLTASQWNAAIATLRETGATPMIDLAYQGFGDGLEADAQATRKMAAALPECLVAASCSKNFGIYRERTGVLMAIAADPAARGLNQETLAFLNRLNYSFPPDHGARIVTLILGDATLRADWAAELEQVRLSMLALRSQLATTLRDMSGSDRFGFLASHRGMFSRLGASAEQVATLRRDHAVYMVGDSRMNIAGLNVRNVPVLARAILDTGI
ncbi:MAG: aspartate/tyrosine/aromatic aminotransferase [Rhodobacteraceae bacterium]|nr:aspartate/tyrosine/aromatic aminotransferase [Paracoccaceae bacterium]